MAMLRCPLRLPTFIGLPIAAGLIVSGLGIFLGGCDTNRPAAGQPTPSPTSASVSPGSANITVTVYFHRDGTTDPRQVSPLTRTVAATSMVATAALKELLAGPTSSERAAGYHSFFSAATADMLRRISIRDGVAYVDFRDFSQVIPNASSSAGSAALLAELDTTLKQFSNVRSTVYSFDGNIAAFYEWLQLKPPVEDLA